MWGSLMLAPIMLTTEVSIFAIVTCSIYIVHFVLSFVSYLIVLTVVFCK